MLRRFTQVTLSAVIPLCICAVALPQEGGEPAKKGPQWKDQAEYTLVSTAYQEKDPNKKLQLLDEWKQKYPETDFSLDRVRVYMATYQQARQNGKAVETAKELLGVVPGDFSANVTIASFPGIFYTFPGKDRCRDAHRWRVGRSGAAEGN